MECVLTEKKILQMTACQGFFKIRLSESTAHNKVKIVLDLVENNYLELTETTNKDAIYRITDEGKEYLKGLHSNNEPPKHYLSPELVTKGNKLEAVLIKRLNLLRSANKRGLEFNLTDTNIKGLLNKKTCHYTGVTFDEKNDPLNVRTFERVDDSKGYVQGNVVVVTLRANRIKNLLLEGDNELKIDVKQFIKMAEQIKNHIGE